jgi:hypothetical protein
VRQRARDRNTPDIGEVNRKDNDLGQDSWQLQDQDSANSALAAARHPVVLPE